MTWLDEIEDIDRKPFDIHLKLKKGQQDHYEIYKVGEFTKKRQPHEPKWVKSGQYIKVEFDQTVEVMVRRVGSPFANELGRLIKKHGLPLEVVIYRERDDMGAYRLRLDK